MQWANTLEQLASPIIGRMLVQYIGQAQVLAVLEPMTGWAEFLATPSTKAKVLPMKSKRA